MKKAALSELCFIDIGRTPSRSNSEFWGSGFKWVSISDMKTETIFKTKEEITPTAVKSIRLKMVPKGTLLLSFKLSVGKLAFAGTDLFTNEAIASLVIKNTSILHSRFLFYSLKNIKFDGGNIAVKGLTLNSKSLSKLKIPLPSLPEQIRIAYILSKAENLIAQRKESLRLLDEFLKSTFLEMFGEKTLSLAGNLKTIGEICTYRGGGTPSTSKPEYFTGNIPWVSPKDMKSLAIVTSQDKITEQAIKESSTALIPSGSVLMVIRSGILKNKLPLAINKVDVAINQDLKAFQSKHVLPEYLLYFFISAEKGILKKVKGTTADNLSFGDILNLKINVPPLSLQTQFADIVKKTEVLKERYQASLAELENLYQSLSQRAFKGELGVKENPVSIAAEPGVGYGS